MSIRQKKLAFQTRTHMLRTAPNFGSTTTCPLGCDKVDDQEHLVMNCDIVKLNNFEVLTNTEVKYEDVFGEDVDKIKKAVVIVEKSVRTREILLN